MGKMGKKDWSWLLLVTLLKFLIGTHTGRGTLLSWCCRGCEATTHTVCPNYIPRFFLRSSCTMLLPSELKSLSPGSSDICAALPFSSLNPLCSFRFLQQLHLQSLQGQPNSLVRFHHSSDAPTFIGGICSSWPGWSQFVPALSQICLQGRSKGGTGLLYLPWPCPPGKGVISVA